MQPPSPSTTPAPHFAFTSFHKLDRLFSFHTRKSSSDVQADSAVATEQTNGRSTVAPPPLTPSFSTLVFFRAKQERRGRVPSRMEVVDNLGLPMGGLRGSKFSKRIELRHRSLKERIFLAFSDPRDSFLGLLIFVFLILVILISSISFVVETLPSSLEYTDECVVCKPVRGDDLLNSTMVEERIDLADYCQSCEPKRKHVFTVIEIVSVSYFTFEYLVRVATCHSRLSTKEVNKARINHAPYEFPRNRILHRTFLFVIEDMNLIDLISILPFYISFFGGGATKLSVLRVLRFLRVFRVVRFGEFSSGLEMFVKVFRKSMTGFGILFVFSFMGMVVVGSIVYFAEQGSWDPRTGEFTRQSLANLGPAETSPFISIPQAFWWVLVTFTTVGYGDMYPTTPVGNFIAVVAMYLGTFFLAMPLTIIGANFTEAYETAKEEIRQSKLREAKRSGLLMEVFMAQEGSVRMFFAKWRAIARKEIDLEKTVTVAVEKALRRAMLEDHKLHQETRQRMDLLQTRVERIEEKLDKELELLSAILAKLN